MRSPTFLLSFLVTIQICYLTSFLYWFPQIRSQHQSPATAASSFISFTEFLLPCPELAWKILDAFLSPHFLSSWNHLHLLAIPKAKLHHCCSYSFLFLPANLRANTEDSHWNSGAKRSHHLDLLYIHDWMPFSSGSRWHKCHWDRQSPKHYVLIGVESWGSLRDLWGWQTLVKFSI